MKRAYEITDDFLREFGRTTARIEQAIAQVGGEEPSAERTMALEDLLRRKEQLARAWTAWLGK